MCSSCQCALPAECFEDVPVPLVAMDRDRRIHYANLCASVLFGIEGPSQLADVQIDGFSSVESPCSSEGRHRDVGLSEVIRPDGGRLPVVSYRSGELDGHDDGTRLLALVQLGDLGDEASVFRARAEALLRSNRELDSFASVVSHDLKGPLRGIESLVSWVLEDSAGSLPASSLEHLQQAQRRATRLTAMLDDLLTYARLGREDESVGLVDLGELVAELVDLYVPADRFTVRVDPGLPVIRAPRALVDVVARNLLMNAVAHHDRPRGAITITTEPRDDHHVMAITDDGPGIDPAHRERVFKLFATRRPMGDDPSTGMGLALARRAMDIMGGSVTIRTPPERGVSFVLSWQRQDAPR